MALFGRKRADKRSATKDEVPAQAAQESAEPAASSEASSEVDAPEAAPGVPVLGTHTAADLGPFDSGAVPRPEGFLDFGSVWMPNLPGVVFMVETDQESGDVTGLRLQIAQSVLQVQVFATPKSRDLWTEIRDEIAASLRTSGARAEEARGPYGEELLATVPTPTQQGGYTTTTMRFLGVDGPRWFLRGVISGPAATDEALAQPFVDLLRVVVVHRGDAARAPRELLPMHMPRNIEATDPADSVEEALRAELKPFERGPEITEVR